MSNHVLAERDPEHYFNHRPRVPVDILNIAKSIYRKPIDLVVDLGSGPGNSTQDWSKVSSQVIGVEPSKKLFDYATKNQPDNVSYLNCFADDTGIDADSVDIVTSSSAIHWMEPIETSKEILRILKREGLFIHFGPYTPLTPFLELDTLYIKYKTNKDIKSKRHNWGGTPEDHFLKDEFKYIRKFYVSEKISWSASNYIEWIKSKGDIRNRTEKDRLISMITEVADQLWLAQEQVVFTYTAWCFKDKIK